MKKWTEQNKLTHKQKKIWITLDVYVKSTLNSRILLHLQAYLFV